MSTSSQGPIRLAYIITRILYFLFVLAWGIVFLLFIAQLFSGLPDSWRFSMDLPLKLDIAESGVLSVSGEQIPVNLEAIRGIVTMDSSPALLIWVPGLITLVCVAMIIVALWCFKSFLGYMEAGDFFHKQASLRLRQTAGWITLVWLVQVTSTFWLAAWVQSHISFNGVSINTSFSWELAWLALALFLWIVSRILDHGRELEEEQKLTI